MSQMCDAFFPAILMAACNAERVPRPKPMCASQGLPFPELPSIEWIIKAVEVLLGKVIVNKALVLPIGDEGEAPSLDMSSVGLGTFSLTQLHSMSTAERASLVHGIASHLRDNHLKIGWRAGRLVNDIVVEKPSLTDGSSSLTCKCARYGHRRQ